MLDDAWIPAFAGMTYKKLALGFNQKKLEIPTLSRLKAAPKQITIHND